EEPGAVAEQALGAPEAPGAVTIPAAEVAFLARQVRVARVDLRPDRAQVDAGVVRQEPLDISPALLERQADERRDGGGLVLHDRHGRAKPRHSARAGPRPPHGI